MTYKSGLNSRKPHGRSALILKLSSEQLGLSSAHCCILWSCTALPNKVAILADNTYSVTSNDVKVEH